MALNQTLYPLADTVSLFLLITFGLKNVLKVKEEVLLWTLLGIKEWKGMEYFWVKSTGKRIKPTVFTCSMLPFWWSELLSSVLVPNCKHKRKAIYTVGILKGTADQHACYECYIHLYDCCTTLHTL